MNSRQSISSDPSDIRDEKWVLARLRRGDKLRWGRMYQNDKLVDAVAYFERTGKAKEPYIHWPLIVGLARRKLIQAKSNFHLCGSDHHQESGEITLSRQGEKVPRKSWRGLKIGQHLISRDGVERVVISVETDGVTLKDVLPGRSSGFLRVTRLDWDVTYTKIQKPRRED